MNVIIYCVSRYLGYTDIVNLSLTSHLNHNILSTAVNRKRQSFEKELSEQTESYLMSDSAQKINVNPDTFPLIKYVDRPLLIAKLDLPNKLKRVIESVLVSPEHLFKKMSYHESLVYTILHILYK